tara:strand:- start:193 stop:717 length:525 start_codon:yes stop_codon:yes gene_type:complete
MSEYRVSPVGIAKYSYVSEPDKQFDSEGSYHVSLVFTKEEAQSEIKAINDVIAKKIADIYKAKPQTKNIRRAPLPFKEEEGKIVMKFKSKYKPKGFDKFKKPLPTETIVYKNSTMRVRYKLNPYDQSIGVGCSLYIVSFQVNNLVEGQSEVECPFDQLTDQNVSRLPGPKSVTL